MRKIEVRVPEQMHQELVKNKFYTGIDMTEQIRVAIAEFLEKRKVASISWEEARQKRKEAKYGASLEKPLT